MIDIIQFVALGVLAVVAFRQNVTIIALTKITRGIRGREIGVAQQIDSMRRPILRNRELMAVRRGLDQDLEEQRNG